jgi:N-acetylglucosamine malate deacetylase 1
LVYHYIQWKNIEPDFVVDISGFYDKKEAAILAYSSQFYNPNSKEPEHQLQPKTF